MKYVKIKAKSYNEALMQLRMQYGEDAIPISHKYLKEGGLLNSRFFAKDVVELTAAIHERKKNSAAVKEEVKKHPPREERKSSLDVVIDNDYTKAYTAPQNLDLGTLPGVGRQATFGRFSSAQAYQETPVRAAVEPDTLFRDIPSMKVEAEPQVHRKHVPEKKSDMVELSKAEYENLLKFEKEFKDIKETLNSFMDNQKKTVKTKVEKKEIEIELKPYHDVLRKNDFDDGECEKIMKEVRNSLDKDEIKDRFKVEKTLKDLLKSKIVTTGPIRVGSRKKIIMFVGPTGVGKTTSLAKIGAMFALRESKKVSFITIDTYRIAATEQLKKYAEIMKIPIHVVNDQKEFKGVIDREKADVILVDTSGRSHKNAMKISEIKTFADQIDYDFEKILCISATTKKDDVVSIFNSFEIMNCDSVLITKVDETSFVGNVVDIADKYNKPISYIANGQEVPNDIIVADSEKIVDMMVVGTESRA